MADVTDAALVAAFDAALDAAGFGTPDVDAAAVAEAVRQLFDQHSGLRGDRQTEARLALLNPSLQVPASSVPTPLVATIDTPNGSDQPPAAQTPTQAVSNAIVASRFHVVTNQVGAPHDGFSENYAGDRELDGNRPIAVLVGQETAFWLTGLPADVTHSEILGAIRNTGRVYQLHINRPTGEHRYPAARLFFFSRDAAAAFEQNTENGFYVRNQRVRLDINRFNLQVFPLRRSRVLLIRGPAWLVSWEALQALLAPPNIRYYDIDRVFPLRAQRGGRMLLEVHFASFRAQAESAAVVVRRNWTRFGVSVQFGRDPCGDA
ncbi:hypothetical protein OQA88_1435 [Cercophora sp. LCS_1]